jgi:hypothetical protein
MIPHCEDVKWSYHKNGQTKTDFIPKEYWRILGLTHWRISSYTIHRFKTLLVPLLVKCTKTINRSMNRITNNTIIRGCLVIYTKSCFYYRTLKQILTKISLSIEQCTVLAVCLIPVQTWDRYSQDWTSMYIVSCTDFRFILLIKTLCNALESRYDIQYIHYNCLSYLSWSRICSGYFLAGSYDVHILKLCTAWCHGQIGTQHEGVSKYIRLLSRLFDYPDNYTVKKGSWVSRLQPGCHEPNSPWAGIIQLWRHYSRPGRVW